MPLLDWILLVLVAGICGSIGQAIAGYSHGGFLVSVAVGLIGALLGRWISARMRLPEPFTLTIDGHGFPLLWSIIGADTQIGATKLWTGIDLVQNNIESPYRMSDHDQEAKVR